MEKSKTISEYLAKHSQWESGLKLIRQLLNDTELTETIKWGMPTYTINNKNIIGLAGFKNHFGVWFHQGLFLSDTDGILTNAQEGKTKAMRHIKYTANDQINESQLKTYILESIENQKAGKEIKIGKRKDYVELTQFMVDHLPTETINKLNSLTPSKRREYIEYITTAKRDNTKLVRIEKIIPLIEQGVGINDVYRKK